MVARQERGSRRPRDVWRRLKRFDARYLARPEVENLAGIDEAGRGALAGPVVAAVVVVDASARFEGLNDSKQLSAARREALYADIRADARGMAIGWASAAEIDRINILQATLLAAHRAVDALGRLPDMILTDALKLAEASRPVEALIRGDARSQAIAAASVIAKVTRDRWMHALDAEYPGYGFAANKGYGVASHMRAIERHGPSTVHRHSFRGVDWFDREYRPSRTLEQLVEQARQGAIDSADREAVWLGRGHALPECERETFFAAIGQSQAAQAAAGVATS